MNTSASPQIGIIVNAGPSIGYGHVVRCLRLANVLAADAGIAFYPLSEACRDFLVSSNTDGKFEIRESNSVLNGLPSLVITDLREVHGITAAIHRQGSRHISIHDLGLGQCYSDVVIDGSITRLFPYAPDKKRTFFIGPQLADRFAAVHASAAAPATSNDVGKNLRNTRFTYMVGEHDTRYGLKAVWYVIEFSDLVGIKSGHLMYEQAQGCGLDDQIGDGESNVMEGVAIGLTVHVECELGD